MSPEKQRIAIAEVCGWTEIKLSTPWEVSDPPEDRIVLRGFINGMKGPIPDYLNDLNVMHEAELSLSFDQWMGFSNTLQQLTENDTESPAFNRGMSATAAQRAEAFLRTLNLWTE